jgi:hypothetical protein
MCIISGQVHYVANTRIFAYPYNDRQMTVYQNQVGTGKQALMILPVPYPQSIRFEEAVMKTPDFFGLCERSFTIEHTLSVTRSLSAEGQAKQYLEVRNIGPYAVSVANTLEDIQRLDPSVFQLEEELTFLLQGQYPSPFGFLCCVLRRGEQKYEPLAYSHKRLFPDRLFLPTLHYHTHPGDFGHTEEWSHDIYTLLTSPYEAHTDSKARPKIPNHLDTDRFPPSGTDNRSLRMVPLRKWSKHGPYKNVDLEFLIENQPWIG